MLSVVSPIVNCREDLSKVVYALFITHLEKFSNATSPVVILRIIRALGYYPTSLYYGFIKRSMGRGRAFIL